MAAGQSSGTRPKTVSTRRKPCWPHCSEKELADRLFRLRELFREAEISAFLLSSQENLGYFTGLYLEGLLCLVLPGRVVVYGNPLACREAEFYLPGGRPVRPEKSFWKGRVLTDGAKVGVEPGLSASVLHRMREAFPGRDFLPSELALSVRSVKSEGELRLLRRTGRLLAEARTVFLETIDPRVTESEAVDALAGILASRGAREAFPTIYAAGPVAAFPHALPRRRAPGAREWVVLDCGARWFFYCADCTRVLFPERLSARGGRFLDHLRRARDAAEKAARPGALARSVDAAARGILETAGLGSYFIHGLGHGVGLAVHELPRLSPRSEDRLVEGMVFTIEPGVYLPGWGGLRIEDTYIMRSDGPENITGAGR